ncbi:MAG: hypothetical protein ACLUHA_08085, partial [Bacteroides stercoris]
GYSNLVEKGEAAQNPEFHKKTGTFGVNSQTFVQKLLWSLKKCLSLHLRTLDFLVAKIFCLV